MEVLEVRQVMSAVPLTPAQIATAVSNAQTNQANAEQALQTAQGNFTTQTTAATNGLQTALAGLTTAAQGAIDGQATTTQATISAAETTLNGAIQGLETALQGTLDGFQQTLNGLLATANTLHQTQVTAVQNQFQLDFDTIQSSYNSAVAGIISGFQLSVDSAEATYDSTVDGAESAFDLAVSGFDTLFQGLVTSETNLFNTNEANAWTNLYLNVVGTAPTGLQTIYDSAISAADVILNGVLTANTTVTYDPSVILNYSTFQTYVTGQFVISQPLFQGNLDTYDTNVTNRKVLFIDQLTGPSGTTTAYESQMAVLIGNYQDDVDSFDSQLDTDLQGDQQTYMLAIHGPGGVEDQLEAAIDGEETAFEGAIQAAQGTYDSTMSGPVTTLESTIDTEIDNYENWITSGNPYQAQANLRVDSLISQIQGFADTYNGVVTGAQTQLGTDIATANLLYWEQIYKPNATPQSAFDGFMSAVGSQLSTLNGELQTEYTDYQDNAQGVWNSYYMAMMSWMMTGMIGSMPVLNTSLIDGFAKDYWVNASIDSAGATDGIGGAYVAFVSAAASADTTREQSIITAQATCATTIENGANAFVIAAENAMQACDIDLVNISHAFAGDAATRYLNATGNIDAAINVYEIVEHGAGNQFRKDANVAVNAYEKNCASDINTFQQLANQHARLYTINAAGSVATYQNAVALRTQSFVMAQATATETYELSLKFIENTAQRDLNDYAETMTFSRTSNLLTLVTNLANQLATDYAAYYGNAAPVVAVANAQAANQITKLTAWKAVVDGEATAFKNYGNQVADDLKTASDNIATGAKQRALQVAPQWLNLASTAIGAWSTEVATLAPLQETANNSIADEERDAVQDVSDKEKTANDALANHDRQLADTTANDILSAQNQENGAIGSNFGIENNLAKTFNLFAVGEEFNFLSFLEGQIHGTATGSIGAKSSVAMNLSTMDDSLENAQATVESATASNQAWQQVNNELNTPTSDYANRRPGGPASTGTPTAPMPGSSASGESFDAALQQILARTGAPMSQPSRAGILTSGAQPKVISPIGNQASARMRNPSHVPSGTVMTVGGRDLNSRFPWGVHRFMIVSWDKETVFPEKILDALGRANGLQTITPRALSRTRVGFTVGGHNIDEMLVTLFNEPADLQSVRESWDPRSFPSESYFSDFSLSTQLVFNYRPGHPGCTHMNPDVALEKMATAISNYGLFPGVRYFPVGSNCNAWVNQGQRA